jgi:hypothetical protein
MDGAGRRDGRLGRALGIVVATAFAAMLLTVPSASAATTVSQTHTFPCVPLNPPIPGTCAGGLSATLTPTCAEGQKAVGGGFWFDSFRVAVAVYESRRVGERTWRVSGFLDDTRAAGDLVAYAYCSPLSAAVVERAQTVSLAGPRGTLRSATATCPTGTRPIAGGWSGTPASYFGGSLMRQSERISATAWRVSAVKANQLGISPDLTGHVYCAATPALRTAARAATVAAPPVGALRNAGGVVTPPCSGPTFASGGFRLAPYGSVLARLSELRLAAGGSWSAAAVTYRPPPGNPLYGLPVPNWRLTAIAYCG